MAESVYVLSTDPDLLRAASTVLVPRGASYLDDELRFEDRAGRRFTIRRSAPADLARREPFHPEPGVELPDLSTITPFLVECGSVELFVDVVRRIAVSSVALTWVLDGADVVWDTNAVDAARLTL